jgi:hypothetical protein
MAPRPFLICRPVKRWPDTLQIYLFFRLSILKFAEPGGQRDMPHCRAFGCPFGGHAGRAPQGSVLKRAAFKRIHATRFISLFLSMSLSRNRCTLSGDML